MLWIQWGRCWWNSFLKKLLINLSIAKTSSKGGASGICMDYMKKQLTPVLLKCYSEFNCYCAWAFIKHTLDSCKNSQAVVRNTPLRTVMLEFCGTKLWNCENTFWCQTLHYAPKKQPQNVQLRKVISSKTICFARSSICSFRPYWIHL